MARKKTASVTTQRKTNRFLESTLRVFKYSRKPNHQEYSAYLKIVGLAILVTGGVAFIIHLIASMLTLTLGG